MLYLVGTSKGRLTQLEGRLAELPWHQAREGVEVKLRVARAYSPSRAATWATSLSPRPDRPITTT